MANKKLKKYYAVMKMYSFDTAFEIEGPLPVQANFDKDSPSHFIPIFSSRRKAVEWAGKNNEQYIQEVRLL